MKRFFASMPSTLVFSLKQGLCFVAVLLVSIVGSLFLVNGIYDFYGFERGAYGNIEVQQAFLALALLVFSLFLVLRDHIRASHTKMVGETRWLRDSNPLLRFVEVVVVMDNRRNRCPYRLSVTGISLPLVFAHVTEWMKLYAAELEFVIVPSAWDAMLDGESDVLEVEVRRSGSALPADETAVEHPVQEGSS